MKKFFMRLAGYFVFVAAIDLVVDYLYYKSLETTVLGGDPRTIIIMFIAVLVGTILLTMHERMKRTDEQEG